MKLKERKVHAFTPPEAGTLMHAVMETFVKEAIALLKKSNVKLLGTVMTMVDAKQSRSYINGRYTNYYYNGK